MKTITAKAMSTLVELWMEDEELAPKGRFYCFDNGVWVGCDNVTGDCWVEEFETKEAVIQWLNDVNDYLLNETA